MASDHLASWGVSVWLMSVCSAVCVVCCVTSCAQTHKHTPTSFLLCNEQKNKSAVSSVLCSVAVYWRVADWLRWSMNCEAAKDRRSFFMIQIIKFLQTNREILLQDWLENHVTARWKDLRTLNDFQTPSEGRADKETQSRWTQSWFYSERQFNSCRKYWRSKVRRAAPTLHRVQTQTHKLWLTSPLNFVCKKCESAWKHSVFSDTKR